MKMIVSVPVLVTALIVLSGAAMPETQKKNPYEGNAKAAVEGADLFNKNCRVCHGEGGKGDICPSLTTRNKKYGDSDEDLFVTISKGRPGGMPNWENVLGADRIWKVIAYIRSIETK